MGQAKKLLRNFVVEFRQRPHVQEVGSHYHTFGTFVHVQ